MKELNKKLNEINNNNNNEHPSMKQERNNDHLRKQQ